MTKRNFIKILTEELSNIEAAMGDVSDETKTVLNGKIVLLKYVIRRARDLDCCHFCDNTMIPKTGRGL